MTSETSEAAAQLRDALKDLPSNADRVCDLARELSNAPEPSAAYALLVLALIPSDGVSPELARPRETWINQFRALPVRNRYLPGATVAAPSPGIVVDTAVSSLANLVANIPAQDLPVFDHRIRSLSGSYWNEIPLSRAMQSLRAMTPGTGRTAVLGVLSSYWDGYVREAAVGGLAACAGGEEIPFLLWRCADWVEQVREPAIAAIYARLTNANCGALARALPLVPRMEAVRRSDPSELIAAIYDTLLREPGQASLVAALGSDNARVRRQACAVLGRMPAAPSLAVIAAVSQDKDAVVRRWALRWEARLRTVDPDAARVVRMSLLNDPTSEIRAEALRTLAAADGLDAVPLLRRYLADPSATVRQAVRYRLWKMIPGTDLAAVYRETLAAFVVGDSGMIRRRADTGRLIGAIAGLGETGKADDIGWITPFLQYRPRVAVTVLRAMKSLSEDTAHPVLLGSVVDVRPGVRRVARNLLGDRLPDGDAKTVRDLWLKIDAAVSPDALADITLCLSPWHALGVLLAASARPSVRPSALDALGRWRPEQVAHYTASPPSVGVKAELVESLESGLAIIPTMLWQRLRKAIEG